jgi:hypothetical protein
MSFESQNWKHTLFDTKTHPPVTRGGFEHMPFTFSICVQTMSTKVKTHDHIHHMSLPFWPLWPNFASIILTNIHTNTTHNPHLICWTEIRNRKNSFIIEGLYIHLYIPHSLIATQTKHKRT